MSDPNSIPIITVFGGGGFIGRYACEHLLKHDVRLRVAERQPKRASRLQPLGDVGQVALMPADLTRPATVQRAVVNASAVINLVGTFDGDLESVHVEGARTAALAAKEAGAKAFVHVSAIGADPDATSVYGRTKGEGEQAVRDAFPGATILRPSVVFGPEDEFTNRFASMSILPFLPVLAPKCRFQPVFAGDLGKAIAEAALRPDRHGGKTYDIAGPDVLTMHELNERIARMAGRSPQIVDLPDFVGDAMSRLGFLPGAPISRDQWLMLQSDNVADPARPGLADMGIEATPLAQAAPEWLGRYRKGGRFAVSETA
ncbi:complex I NDUFA9 subunit family protein [Sphingomicrobium lutaoense]|uniref:NADH dehydrogenase n=1 Tax=Sphingomicrobium lutaoense TaxID=515949 RepID=A0A839YZM3_9SPHN|nr:complex I NDUFA9 subunit family protein [Sphingomicrobium lutaoense]MBB3764446.1 NADH dehydrogenase [Sphingomicrobium lutaoense]